MTCYQALFDSFYLRRKNKNKNVLLVLASYSLGQFDFFPFACNAINILRVFFIFYYEETLLKFSVIDELFGSEFFSFSDLLTFYLSSSLNKDIYIFKFSIDLQLSEVKKY